MKNSTKRKWTSILKSIIIFMTGVLVSQWVFVMKDLSFISNLITLFLIGICLKIGFVNED